MIKKTSADLAHDGTLTPLWTLPRQRTAGPHAVLIRGHAREVVMEQNRDPAPPDGSEDDQGSEAIASYQEWRARVMGAGSPEESENSQR